MLQLSYEFEFYSKHLSFSLRCQNTIFPCLVDCIWLFFTPSFETSLCAFISFLQLGNLLSQALQILCIPLLPQLFQETNNLECFMFSHAFYVIWKFTLFYGKIVCILLGSYIFSFLRIYLKLLHHDLEILWILHNLLDRKYLR